MTYVVPSGAEVLYVIEFEKAEISRALKHWDSMSLKQFMRNTSIARPLSKCFNRSELGKYSSGFQLYFKLLQTLMILFAVACIPAIYLLYSNLSGDGYSQIRSPFDTFTLGNQGYSSSSSSALSNEQLAALSSQFTLQSSIDLGITALVILFYIYYSYSSSKEKEEIDMDNCNVSDFAVEIEGIPPKGASEMEVARHFGVLFGTIIQCKFARDYQGTMIYFKDIAELQDDKKRLEAKIGYGVSKDVKKVAQMEKKIQKLQAYTAQRLKKKFGESIQTHTDYPAVKAFVLFDSMIAQKKALNLYGKYQTMSICRFILCCRRKKLPPKLQLLGKYNIRVYQADEPTNIKWENQDTRPLEGFLRFLLVLLVVILCLVFTFAFIIASNVLSFNVQQGASCSDRTSISVNCRCAGLPLSQSLLDNSCAEYIKARIIQIAMSVLSGFCITIINFIIQQIFISLGKFQRYSTVSRESAATTVKYFISLFINTAIIPILANSNINGFQLSKKIVQFFIFETDSLINSTFPGDFDRSWYSQVGAKIMSPMIIAIISPHFLSLIAIPCKRCIRARRAKSTFFQKDLNKLYTPPQFKISFNYSIALNILFVTLTFCSGMPLLYFTGLASFMFINFSEKYIIARNCRKPPGFDDTANNFMIKAMPIAILFHCLAAIWMFGCPIIFPYPTSSTSSGSSATVMSRIKRCLPHAILAIVVVVWMIFKAFILPLILGCSSSADKKSENRAELRRFGRYRQEGPKLAQLGIASYNIRANPDYSDIIKAMRLEIEEDDPTGSAKGVIIKVEPSQETNRLLTETNLISQNTGRSLKITRGRRNQVAPLIK